MVENLTSDGDRQATGDGFRFTQVCLMLEGALKQTIKLETSSDKSHAVR
jgi:hypothetical protein